MPILMTHKNSLLGNFGKGGTRTSHFSQDGIFTLSHLAGGDLNCLENLKDVFKKLKVHLEIFCISIFMKHSSSEKLFAKYCNYR